MKLLHKLTIIAATLAFADEVKAQADLHNTGVLYITGASDLLYVDGSLTNTASALLTNNGTIYLTRHLSNSQASMAAGTGTLNLTGSIQQQVNGTQLFRTYNLVTNNAAGVLLNNDLSIAALHTFAGGVISTSATPNYLVYETGSSYTGDGDTRHVNGWIRKTGTTAFSFPVGNGTVERKIAVSNLSSSAVFNARYAGPTTNTANIASPLFTVDPNEYWQINKISGGTANVDMNWDNSKVNMPNYGLPDIKVANYISGNWTQVGGAASGNTSTTGSVSSNSISTFGAFTFGSISVILPVRLLSFSGTKSNGNALLKWNTTDETNVHHHEPQRSDDGIVFFKVGEVGARNNRGIQSYEFPDPGPLKPVTYYRLRSVDNDGSSTLSKIITLAHETANPGISIVNPAYNTIHGNTAATSGTYQYQLTTLSGQVVQQGQVITTSTGFDIPVANSVIKGMYLLRLQKPGLNVVQKVIIER